MANLRTHFAVGGLVGLGSYLLWKKLHQEPASLSGTLLSVLGGCLIASLPDQFEPANSPGHRALFHSLVAGGILEEVARKKLRDPLLNPGEKQLWLIFALSYGSHLFLDALTPSGLPLLRK